MKVKVSLSSDDGVSWTAEAKDLGLIKDAASMISALEEMQEEIQKFFADAFGSNKRIEVLCSKIKATANVTVAPLDDEYRPEKPLTEFTLGPDQDLIDTPDLLALPSGEEDIEIEYDEPHIELGPAESDDDGDTELPNCPPRKQFSSVKYCQTIECPDLGKEEWPPDSGRFRKVCIPAGNRIPGNIVCPKEVA